MVPFSRNHCDRLTFILSTHKASLTRRGSVRNWGKELHLSPHASSLWYGLVVVVCFFFFDCLFWFHRCQRRPNEAAKPKTDRCLPLPFSWHHGGLPPSGSDHPGASVENSKPGFFPPRGTCTGRSGCWPLPMAGALSSSLSSKATSSRTPSLATMLKGVALPHPRRTSLSHRAFGARLLANITPAALC